MMNEFQRFWGKILAETCLKMDYFGSVSPKLLNAGDSASQTTVLIQWIENVQRAYSGTLIEQFWLMQMLENFGAKRNFIFSTLLPV